MNKKEFVIELYKIGAIKFGEFTLKSGVKSPFYFDLRDIISYPHLLKGISCLIADYIKKLDFDYVSGIPYTALPIATLVSEELKKPLIYVRKEEKTYGTQNPIIGKFQKWKKTLLIDDLITSGESIFETAEKFEKAGLSIRDVVVIIDRSAEAQIKLEEKGYRLHSLVNLDELLTILKSESLINEDIAKKIQDFVATSAQNNLIKPAENDLTKKLQNLIKKKKSRLVLSLDVDNSRDFFKILDKTAPHIVMLKTHIDILEDFTPEFITKLQDYARQYDFMIFEDRKFADIGNTVRKQYRKGIYKIKDWSDFVTVHGIPGKGILQGLFDGTTERSGFLLAKMSSRGNLMNDTYTRKIFEMGAAHPQWVSGYIVHAHNKEELKRLKNKIRPGQLLLMPGVKLEKDTDSLGQQYTGVEEAIAGGADLIIVGRGIINAENPGETARQYKERSWKNDLV
jgi:uridine monophosphate synthetase